MPAMPEGEGVREGILRGIYKFKAAANGPAEGAALRQRSHPERGRCARSRSSPRSTASPPMCGA